MTNAQIEAITMLKLANNGVTMAQSVDKKYIAAIKELIAANIVEETTAIMYKFGAMPAYKLT